MSSRFLNFRILAGCQLLPKAVSSPVMAMTTRIMRMMLPEFAIMRAKTLVKGTRTHLAVHLGSVPTEGFVPDIKSTSNMLYFRDGGLSEPCNAAHGSDHSRLVRGLPMIERSQLIEVGIIWTLVASPVFSLLVRDHLLCTSGSEDSGWFMCFNGVWLKEQDYVILYCHEAIKFRYHHGACISVCRKYARALQLRERHREQ